MMESANGKEIRQLAHRYLDEDARSKFKRAIKQFTQTRSVSDFVIMLSGIVRSKGDHIFMSELGNHLPKEFQIDFFALCCDLVEGYREYCAHSEQTNSHSREAYSVGEKTPRKESVKHISLPDQYKTSTFRSIKSFRDAEWEEFKDVNDSMENNHNNPQARTSDQQSNSTRIQQQNRHLTSEKDQSKNLPVRSNVDAETETSAVHSPTPTSCNKLIHMTREDNTEYGFNIHGGCEYGCRIYVSSIDRGSIAAGAGLCVGDRIIRINNIKFHNKTHKEAVDIISKSYTVQFEVVPHPGIRQAIPNNVNVEVACTTNSLPSAVSMLNIESELRGQPDQTHYNNFNKTERSKYDGTYESKYEREYSIIDITPDFDGYIGCSIRGGEDESSSVYISHVDTFSPAYKSDLRPGDKIISINSHEVSGMRHLDVVKLTTSCRELNMKVFHRKQANKLSYTKNIIHNESSSQTLTHTYTPTSHSSHSDNDRCTRSSTPYHNNVPAPELNNHVLNYYQSTDTPHQSQDELLTSDRLNQSPHESQPLTVPQPPINLQKLFEDPQKPHRYRNNVSRRDETSIGQMDERLNKKPETSKVDRYDACRLETRNDGSVTPHNHAKTNQGHTKLSKSQSPYDALQAVEPTSQNCPENNLQVADAAVQAAYDSPNTRTMFNTSTTKCQETRNSAGDRSDYQHNGSIDHSDKHSHDFVSVSRWSSENSDQDEAVTESKIKTVTTAADRLEELFRSSLDKNKRHAVLSYDDDVSSDYVTQRPVTDSTNNNNNENVTTKTKRKPLFQKNRKINSATLRSNLLNADHNTSTKPNFKNISENSQIDSKYSSENLQTRGVYRDGFFEVLI